MVSREEALEKARRAVEERGWAWLEPVHVSRVRAYVFFGRITYEIRTNAAFRGGNVRVVVDANDGTVIAAYRLPR